MIRKLVYICLIVCLSGKSFSCLGGSVLLAEADFTPHKTLDILLAPSSHSYDASMDEFNELLTSIKSKKHKFATDRQYLQFIYKYVHRKSLKTYKTYVTLEETLSKSGYYDCLTGTLLYGLILKELDYNFTIREFNYHALLIVNLNNIDIMIESTDPLNGFVVGEEAINHRIANYKKEDSQKKRTSMYSFAKVIDNEISIDQLAGLHFYNQAINHLNQLELDRAKTEIRKAYALYPSKRVKEITHLICGNSIESLLATND